MRRTASTLGSTPSSSFLIERPKARRASMRSYASNISRRSPSSSYVVRTRRRTSSIAAICSRSMSPSSL
eukprot:34647-Prymnesium_polylepis.1